MEKYKKNLKSLFTELEEGFICTPTGLAMKLDQLHSERYTLIIEHFIEVNNTTEIDFNKAAKEFKGLDLIYTDYINQ